eukprot:6457959-Amphidinium_carterae.1
MPHYDDSYTAAQHDTTRAEAFDPDDLTSHCCDFALEEELYSEHLALPHILLTCCLEAFVGRGKYLLRIPPVL